MVHSVTSASRTPTEVQSATASQKSPQEKPTSTPSTNAAAVVISNAGRAALEEATETRDQTAKEARSGDRQAQKLLAKRAAAA